MGWMTQASTSAQKADSVFLFVFALSVAFLVGITAVMIYFVIRYSKKRHPVASQIEGNTWLEITWTAIPLILFLTIFYYGWTNYSYMSNPPRDSMVVKVVGRQWAWSFQYPNGKQTTLLYAALGKPMKLEIRSADVIHGFFIPAFRLKMDAVPGRVNTTWFEPIQLGAYDIECTVICGASHSLMLSKVVIVSEEDFKAWYFGDENAPEPGQAALARAAQATKDEGRAEPPGLVVLRAKNCLACHSVDGKPMVGPTFKGLFGITETMVRGGVEHAARVDEALLKRSIQDPMAERVKGYPPTMPATPFTEQELADALEYLKSLQ